MPNIRGFQAPENIGLNPTDRGPDATAAAARRVGGFFNQVAGATQELGAKTAQLGSTIAGMWNSLGQDAASDVRTVGDVVEKYEDHRQISAGAPAFAKLQDGLTQQWNDTAKNADPNDPSVAANFRDKVLEPALDQFKEGFTTENSQKWAETYADHLRQHMFEKTSADMSTLAGQAAVVNQQQTVNSLSSAVHGDPSSLDFSLAALKGSTEGIIASSPNLTGTQANAARSEILQKGAESIVKSAAIGYIEKTGNVPPWATDPKYSAYINGAELKTLENAARTQTKVNAYYDKQTAIAQRQLADQNVHAAATKTINDNVQVDPQTSQVTINPRFFKDALEIARRNPDAPTAAATARTMLDWGESQQNKERKVVTDPAVASSIDGNMFASDNPTSKMDILKAEAAGKLTRTDAEIRSKIIDQRDKMPADPQFKFAMDGAKELIEGRTAGEKSLQSGKYAAFMQQFLGEYQRQKLAGTLPANALSLRDPNSLLSKTIETYKSPLASAISGNGGISAAPSFNDRFSASAPSSVAASGVPAPATVSKYQAGDIVTTSEGPRRFKGGNFRDKKNWEPVS